MRMRGGMKAGRQAGYIYLTLCNLQVELQLEGCRGLQLHVESVCWMLI